VFDDTPSKFLSDLRTRWTTVVVVVIVVVVVVAAVTLAAVVEIAAAGRRDSSVQLYLLDRQTSRFYTRARSNYKFGL
jgi:hypothetical protein